MSFLLTSDLHFTDKPRDEYRFGIFEWLLEQHSTHKFDAIFVLGDITDSKDKHSSRLVNQIVDGFASISEHCPTYILKGNHDYIDPANPFFRFLSRIEGLRFVNKPFFIAKWKLLMIPHVKDVKEWEALRDKYAGKVQHVMIHQCVEGAIAETGARLSGMSPASIGEMGARWVHAGDIHRPQDVGPVTYVGSPYHIRFGDDFKPRCIYLYPEKDEAWNLYFPTISKHSLKIRDISEIPDLPAGDHVKIQMELPREERVEWPNHKRRILEHCAERKLDVYGIELLVPKNTKRVRLDERPKVTGLTPGEALKGFAKKEGLPSKVRKAGLHFLET